MSIAAVRANAPMAAAATILAGALVTAALIRTGGVAVAERWCLEYALGYYDTVATFLRVDTVVEYEATRLWQPPAPDRYYEAYFEVVDSTWSVRDLRLVPKRDSNHWSTGLDCWLVVEDTSDIHEAFEGFLLGRFFD